MLKKSSRLAFALVAIVAAAEGAVAQPTPVPVRPAPVVRCAGDTQYAFLKAGRYRVTIAGLSSGNLADASLCQEGNRGPGSACWEHILSNKTPWIVEVNHDTRLTLWTRTNGHGASGPANTGCTSDQPVAAAYYFVSGANASVSFAIEPH
ncbi:MAG: hypothetical protein HS111_09945 [Kofleriaceae bacterium]|nr:hypothetical protein [Kofleriaceae bacterium]